MKILLIDDTDSAHDTKTLFIPVHYTVDVVANKADAIYLVNNSHYDCVITEMLVKETNGLEICREIRSRNLTIPIMVYSTMCDHYTKMAMFDAGVDDVVDKSTDPREFLARVYALGRRKERPMELAISTYKNLKINRRYKTVQLNDSFISLSPKEYQLLELLTQLPDKVFSRDEILEQLWDMHADPLTNKVDVYINFLRKKLLQHCTPQEKYLQTVRGFGYRLAWKT